MSLKRKAHHIAKQENSTFPHQGPIVAFLFAYVLDSQEQLDCIWDVVRHAGCSLEDAQKALCDAFKQVLYSQWGISISFFVTYTKVRQWIQTLLWSTQARKILDAKQKQSSHITVPRTTLLPSTEDIEVSHAFKHLVLELGSTPLLRDVFATYPWKVADLKLLDLAVRQGHVEVCQWLVDEKYVDEKKATNKDRKGLLLSAIFKDQIKTFRWVYEMFDCMHNISPRDHYDVLYMTKNIHEDYRWQLSYLQCVHQGGFNLNSTPAAFHTILLNVEYPTQVWLEIQYKLSTLDLPDHVKTVLSRRKEAFLKSS